MRYHFIVMLLFGTIFANVSPMYAGGKSDCKVKAAAFVSNSTMASKRIIKVSFEIESGYFAFGNPVNIEYLEQCATSVKVRSNGKIVAAEVKYPIMRHMKEGKFDISIYDGLINIPVLIASDIDPSSLSIELYVQASGRGICMHPSKIKLTPGVMP